ncbi:uncharacterized protein ARMOST_04156 [Armillaria ostoyae]|uniref:DUF3533 domain-containing protein n=1 Tax=Armillaria ostoyae TaxID=47428 RepID=A0A284QWM2_ARMOS|nr:uncharacterized protein ARMOST_04156 [Armillaria ostoyae]
MGFLAQEGCQREAYLDDIATTIDRVQMMVITYTWVWRDMRGFLALITESQLSDIPHAKMFLDSFQTSFMGGDVELWKTWSKIRTLTKFADKVQAMKEQDVYDDATGSSTACPWYRNAALRLGVRHPGWALWKFPAHNLQEWIVDFDGSTVGNTAVQDLLPSSSSKVSWTEQASSDFFGGAEEVADSTVDQKIWIAVAVNSNLTMALQSAGSAVNPSYDGTETITVYTVEAWNENAYRPLIRPSSFLQLVALSLPDDLASRSTTASQVLMEPIGYTLNNLRPFDIPVVAYIYARADVCNEVPID